MSRILFIASKPFFPWRGTCIRIGHELLALAQLGHEVDFLTVPVGAPTPIPGVRVMTVPNMLLARNLPEGPSVRQSVFHAALLARALGLIMERPYDVVHGYEEAGAIAWLAGRLGRAAVIVERQAGARSKPPSWRLCLKAHHWFERRALRGADVVIAGSGEAMAEAQGLGCGSRACLIHDIPSALETPPEEHIVECRRRLAPNLDDLLLTCVDSSDELRGAEWLLQALPAMRQAEDRIRCAIVGGSVHAIRRLQRALVRQGVEQHVSFLGRLLPLDLSAVLSASDLLVSGSRQTGVRIVLDYLQSGAAVIVPDPAAGTIPEDAVVRVPSRPEALARAVVALSRDPKRRHELGRRGRDYIARGHTLHGFRESVRACHAYVDSRRRENVC